MLEEAGSSATDSLGEEGSSATSTVRDVTDVRNKEEGRRKKEEGRVSANNVLIVLVVAKQ
ncbi:hypothetical protein QUA27_01485 [Microcoleus sp. Pol14C6]|uniref:hypothetical protein n=1 Tax=unclassified Microcoleus TaxID=2642155 RepID=UPI002FD1BF75